MDIFWQDKSVLITGNTGFKGSWLSFWLLELGAHVHGFSLPSDSQPNLHDQLGLQSDMSSHYGDICDADALSRWVSETQPDIVFHLAAQSLVRPSYQKPHQTWNTNVMGTLNLLQAVTRLEKPCSVVVITTDKVYENREWVHPYRETDRLGGHDPYSASKAAAEILVSSWRQSFLAVRPELRVVTARAGNVIGGGDWAEDRFIPDVIRAWQAGTDFLLRNPQSKRPWQHVLEPLSGYLKLARMLFEGNPLSDAYNFGPDPKDAVTTKALLKEVCQHWQGSWRLAGETNQPHEAGILSLSSEQACRHLNYVPRWHLDQAVKATIEWYRSVMLDGHAAKALTSEQIHQFGAP